MSSEIKDFHSLVEGVVKKLNMPIHMSANSLICLDAEIQQLLTENARLKDKVNDLEMILSEMAHT